MTKARMEQMQSSRAADDTPPRGTAIVRPLGHVRAVRESYMLRFADPAQAAVSRSARAWAWAWALGESATAPVTDQRTATPPTRRDIDAEIAIADDRRLRGDKANRADAAATILSWLIGDDDHLPVRTDNPGELVGGFGDVVRSLDQIGGMLALALQGQRRAAAWDRDLKADPDGRRFARQDADYLGGVAATLAWVLGDQPEAPVTRERHAVLTSRVLKRERLSSDDVIEQARYPWMADRLPPLWYGEGVKFTITWLLGDTTAPPVDSAGRGPYDPDSDLPAILREAQARETHRF
jgi:hypothetical protein